MTSRHYKCRDVTSFFNMFSSSILDMKKPLEAISEIERINYQDTYSADFPHVAGISRNSSLLTHGF